jgi:hypothetical protein
MATFKDLKWAILLAEKMGALDSDTAYITYSETLGILGETHNEIIIDLDPQGLEGEAVTLYFSRFQ